MNLITQEKYETERGEIGPYGEGTDLWASKIRRDLKNLSRYVDDGNIDLAVKLWNIYNVPLEGNVNNPPVFAKWGYESFSDYVEQDLGINVKKAQNLRRIGERLEYLKDRVDPEIYKGLKRLGFSKFASIATCLTENNASDWLDRASQLNYAKLSKLAKQYREDKKKINPGKSIHTAVNSENKNELLEPKVPEYDNSTSFLTFSLYPDQKEIVDSALKRAQELSSNKVPSHNLYLICLDFLANNDFTKAGVKQRMAYLSKMEETLGLRLVAFDKEGDIQYGINTLEDVSKIDDSE